MVGSSAVDESVGLLLVVTNVADDEASADDVCVFATSTVVPKDDERLPRKATRVMRDVIIMPFGI